MEPEEPAFCNFIAPTSDIIIDTTVIIVDSLESAYFSVLGGGVENIYSNLLTPPNIITFIS